MSKPCERGATSRNTEPPRLRVAMGFSKIIDCGWQGLFVITAWKIAMTFHTIAVQFITKGFDTAVLSFPDGNRI